MDEAILVEVFVPAVQQTFEVSMPSFYCVGQIKEKLCRMLEDITHHAFLSDHNTTFYLLRMQCNLADGQTIKELRLRHGDEIIIW